MCMFMCMCTRIDVCVYIEELDAQDVCISVCLHICVCIHFNVKLCGVSCSKKVSLTKNSLFNEGISPVVWPYFFSAAKFLAYGKGCVVSVGLASHSLMCIYMYRNKKSIWVDVLAWVCMCVL